MTSGTAAKLFTLLTTFPMVGFGGPWVLCIAADGHISLELEGAACCPIEAPALPQSGIPQSGSVWQAQRQLLPGCDPCIDIPLLIGVAADRTSPLTPARRACSGTTFPAAALPLTGFGGIGEPRGILARVPAPSPAVGALHHLRTVVLRC
jgi:hypothetical protein